jgi:hypothetical protein
VVRAPQHELAAEDDVGNHRRGHPRRLLGFWGGTIAGHIGTRRTMLACDLARAAVLRPCAARGGRTPFSVLLALVAVSGSLPCAALLGAARRRAGLVGEQAEVAQAAALFRLQTTTIFLGPPLAAS